MGVVVALGGEQKSLRRRNLCRRVTKPGSAAFLVISAVPGAFPGTNRECSPLNISGECIWLCCPRSNTLSCLLNEEVVVYYCASGIRTNCFPRQQIKFSESVLSVFKHMRRSLAIYGTEIVYVNYFRQ